MAPAPARIASTPRQNGRTSWNPAVPPPPVPGAVVGNERGGGLGDGDGLGLGVVAPGIVTFGGVVLGVAVPGVVVLGTVARDVAVAGVVVLGVVVIVAVPVPPGENEGGAVDGEPDEHDDTDAVASMAKAAQPRAVPIKRRRP
jgi:hypothetical protein